MDKTTTRLVTRLASRGWVSLNECAKIIDVSYPTMLSMKNRGEVRAIKVGGIFRVYQEEMIRLLTRGNYVPEDISAMVLERVRSGDTSHPSSKQEN